MKRFLIFYLLISTPSFAYEDSIDEINRIRERTNDNIQRILETPPPVVETEHNYMVRDGEGNVSRVWMRRLDR